GGEIRDVWERSGIAASGEFGKAAISAFDAGRDMVLIAGTESLELAAATWEAMVAAANSGRITRQHVRRSFDHIARIKSMLSPPLPQSEMAVGRLRERIGELNLLLQHS